MEALPLSAFEKYPRGGFEPKMSRREAAAILGVQSSSKPAKVNRLIVESFSDQGGSQEDHDRESSRPRWIAVLSSEDQ